MKRLQGPSPVEPAQVSPGRFFWPSMRIGIPALLILFAVLGTFVSLEYNARVAYQAVEQNGLEDLTRAMTRLQNSVEFLMQRQETERVRSELVALGTQADIQTALLIDDKEQVLASIRLADIGKRMAAALPAGFPGDIARALNEARTRQAGKVTLGPGGKAVTGVYPIVLGANPGGLRPERIGILFVQQDLTHERALQRYRVERQALQFGGFLILLASLLWIVLHVGVTRRARRLVDAVGRLASGDLGTRVALSGGDEFARIGAAFDAMAASLQNQRRQRIESEERLALALNASGQGLWDLDLATGKTAFSPEYARMLGYEPREYDPSLSTRLEQIHPEDRDATLQAFEDYVAGAAPDYSVEFRMRRRDGVWIWIHSSGKIVERDAAARPVRMVGTHLDITRRKADEALLRQDREQQKTLREMLEDVVKGGSLEATLGQCLDRLLAVSWLSLLPRGGLFLLGEDGRSLRLAVSRNLSPEILSLCDQVPLGRCHCGVAAASREVQFSQCVDHRHEINYPGMAEHGHYNLPLLSEGEVLGVMALYLPHDFERDPAKEQFLTTVADVLAGFIRRKHAEESLRQLNEDLEGRVQLRTVELLVAKEEAERANLAKSDFLSRMSHELRTPLNAILGFGQLLELEIREEDQADNVQEILHAGRHLLELINEVLDLARIESGKFTVSLEAVPLQPLIEDCLTLIRPLAEARGIRIAAAGRDCGEHVRADRVRLKQVLLNLLSNAVKYNRDQGTVSIACVAAGDAIQVRVSDSGAGLTPEQQGRLFVAFERLDADQNAVEGTGIGLALSKRLVELMEGEIGVESTPGSGSTFWVRLPAAAGHEESASPAAAESAGQESRPASHKRWDVLCIEDNPANLRLIERILARREDIRLLSASAPGLGLELAAAHRPALILLDINLPEMDGYEVMKRLRESPATRDIPVAAISANAMPKDLERGKAAGFADYLTKPLEVERLLRVVDEVVCRAAGGLNAASGPSQEGALPRETHDVWKKKPDLSFSAGRGGQRPGGR